MTNSNDQITAEPSAAIGQILISRTEHTAETLGLLRPGLEPLNCAGWQELIASKARTQT